MVEALESASTQREQLLESYHEVPLRYHSTALEKLSRETVGSRRLAKRQTTDHLLDLVLCEGSLKLGEII
jgi:hypothetical protein